MILIPLVSQIPPLIFSISFFLNLNRTSREGEVENMMEKKREENLKISFNADKKEIAIQRRENEGRERER